MSKEMIEWDGKALVSVNEEIEVMKLLNEAPNPKAVKTNKFANNAAYLDIGLIEAQLDRFFGSLNWSFVVSKLELQVNAIVCVGDLIIFYKDRQIRRSGVGAAEIQLKKGSQTMDVGLISSKALERDVPKAKSQALKNAAHSLGDAFGRSLNRSYKHGYINHSEMDRLRGSIEDIQDQQEIERMREFIENATKPTQLSNLEVPEELKEIYEKKVKELGK